MIECVTNNAKAEADLREILECADVRTETTRPFNLATYNHFQGLLAKHLEAFIWARIGGRPKGWKCKKGDAVAAMRGDVNLVYRAHQVRNDPVRVSMYNCKQHSYLS